MKNIKPYKLFESSKFNTEFINDIEYILFELKDIELVTSVTKDIKYNRFSAIGGFDERIQKQVNLNALSIYIRNINDRFFEISDIKETLLRIKDLSSKNGYGVDIEIDNYFFTFEQFIKSDDDFVEISIIIY